jgi:hypothetical protein
LESYDTDDAWIESKETDRLDRLLKPVSRGLLRVRQRAHDVSSCSRARCEGTSRRRGVRRPPHAAQRGDTLIVEGLHLAAVETRRVRSHVPCRSRSATGTERPRGPCRGDLATVLAAAGADLPGWL